MCLVTFPRSDFALTPSSPPTMSSGSPPSAQHSGYASPAYPMPIVTPAAPTAGPSKPGYSSKPKPGNVFSNDGSFLERFQRIKKVGASLPTILLRRLMVILKEEDEKKQQDDMLAKFVPVSSDPLHY